MKFNNSISHKHLKFMLLYEKHTGLFIWQNGKYKGKIAGGKCGTTHKYITITIDGIAYLAHRLAIFYVNEIWPVDLVDHKDNNGLNNKWDNIRVATRSQNNYNQKTHKNGKIPLKGVHFEKSSGTFVAQINVNKRKIKIGRFLTAELASRAYIKFAENLHKEFAEHNR